MGNLQKVGSVVGEGDITRRPPWGGHPQLINTPGPEHFPSPLLFYLMFFFNHCGRF